MSRIREHIRSGRAAGTSRRFSVVVWSVLTAFLVTGPAVTTGAAGPLDPPFAAARHSDSVPLLPSPTSTSSAPEDTGSPESVSARPDVSSPRRVAPEFRGDRRTPGVGGNPAVGAASGEGQSQVLPPPPEQPPDARPGPGRIWTLTASTLTLDGVRYNGFATKEVNGEQVRTMHFTVDSLRIGDLVQRGRLAGGDDVRVAADRGSVSTITEGPIELYTRELTGTLDVAGYPVVPMRLSPESLLLPNLDLGFLALPRLTFSDAVVRNVDLDGGKLYVPGANIAPE